MKFSRLTSLAALVVGLSVAAAHAIFDVPRMAVSAVSKAASAAADFIVSAFARVASAMPSMDAPTIQPQAKQLTQAKAFHARIVKRDKPVMTASWRMCPSV